MQNKNVSINQPVSSEFSHSRGRFQPFGNLENLRFE